MSDLNEIMSSLTTELKRGTLTLLVLSQLDTPEYGYSLVQKLEEKQAPIEQGTLYPLLRRLEKQGLLSSEWDTTESRPRKFYQRSPLGDTLYAQLKKEWQDVSHTMSVLLEEKIK